MEEEKRKISKKKATVIIIGILIVVYGALCGIYHALTTPYSSTDWKTERNATTTIYSNTKKSVPQKSNLKYSLYSADAILDEQLRYNDFESVLRNVFVKSNKELKNEMNKYIGTDKVKSDMQEIISLSEKYNDEFFTNNNLAIVMIPDAMHKVEVKSVTEDNSITTINIQEKQYVTNLAILTEPSFIFVTLDKNIEGVNFDIYRTTSYEKNENYKATFIFAGVVITIIVIIIACLSISAHNAKIEIKVYKPIIYLYPTEETEITAELGYPEKITCSYPQYKNGWQALAKPNGDLVDLNTKRDLYSLYYESTNVVKFKVEKDGFIVKGTDVAEFLEDKLALLGLNEREAEEFIVYWLPKLQENKYNYIRFATMEEINENMPLKFSTEPDSLIRVLMTYKGLKNPIKVQEQKLKTPERNGFVAVEWGGTEIN